MSGKTDLVTALKAAYDYCEEALASLNDANGLDTATGWREGTRLSFLVEAIGHTSLHYGNMVTYRGSTGSSPRPRQQPPVHCHRPTLGRW